MNREILFRGKRNNSGEWVYGLLTIMWGQYHIMDLDDENTAYPVDSATIGQYTGLTDKNGAEIFDRDIVTATYLDHVYIGTVEYDQAAFWISWQRDCEGRAFLGPSCAIYPIEVIGNIYDNSDMLKEVE